MVQRGGEPDRAWKGLVCVTVSVSDGESETRHAERKGWEVELNASGYSRGSEWRDITWWNTWWMTTQRRKLVLVSVSEAALCTILILPDIDD